MKARISLRALTAGMSLFCACVPFTIPAQPLANDTAPASPPPTGATADAAKLSPSAADVLKLAQAKVPDETIVAFVQNSAKSYSLSASDIIVLRGDGVSDAVLEAMLKQRAPAQVAQPMAQQPAAVYPPPTVQPGAGYEAPSTVYTIPSAPTYIYSDYSYPYYNSYGYPYYGWGYPFTFSLGFGGYYGGHGWYGHGYPWHGGYHGYGHGSYGHGYYGGGYHGGYRGSPGHGYPAGGYHGGMYAGMNGRSGGGFRGSGSTFASAGFHGGAVRSGSFSGGGARMGGFSGGHGGSSGGHHR